jgi:pimeloyl-ACP methyl ester carboxylesterase
MAAYVLVGGGWLGGWCWQRVARRLREEGHDVYPVTLTGLGEGVHLATPEVNLETHITDVVNLIEFEDLHDVVLLGHSYAGLVVTGVADRVPERIAQLVYLDTGAFPDGTVLIDSFPLETRRYVERQVEESGDGWRSPYRHAKSWLTLAVWTGLDDAQLGLLRSRAVDQPFATFRQPLRLENPAREGLPKAGILCSLSLEEVQAMIASGDLVFREMASPNWRFVELTTGHYPMFSRPMIWRRCSSISHRGRRRMTTASARPNGNRQTSNFRERTLHAVS